MKIILVIYFTIFSITLYSQSLSPNQHLTMPNNNIEFLGDMIEVQGVYVRLLGNFGKMWDSGTGAYVNYQMFFPDHNMLIFQSGYISYTLKDGVEPTDANLSVIPLWVGGRYQFNDDRFMPYISFMNGINLVNQNYRVEVETDENGVVHTMLDNTYGDETLVRYAWQVGVGLLVNLFSSLNIDLAAKYNSHFYQTEAMMTGIEYGVGLSWLLNN